MKMSVFLVSLMLASVATVSGQGVCTKENFEKGVYVVPDPNRCHRFYKCSSPTDSNPTSLHCALNLYFNPAVSTCVASRGAFCTDIDPCTVSGTLSYQLDISCSHYCTCASGSTSECFCCPDGEKFDATSGVCVADAACTGNCETPSKPAEPCLLTPHSTDVTKYVESGLIRNCAPGTSFVLKDCGCTGHTSANVPPGCSHQIYLPFDSTIKDVNNRVYITEVDSVNILTSASGIPAGQTGSGGAQFGNGRLEIDMFTNGWYGSEFTVTLSFYPQNSAATFPAGSKETLVTNVGLSEQATFSVWYQRAEKQVKAAVAGANAVVDNIDLDSWHAVRVEFKNKVLKLTVDGTANSGSSSSNTNYIPATSQPLQIGGARNNDLNLSGYMDEFKLYKC